MSIFDTARSLGEELVSSPEYIALKEAEEAQFADEVAMKALEEYSTFGQRLADEARSGEVSKERMSQIRQLMNEKNQALLENQTIAAYLKAKNDFEAVLEQVNNIIRFYVKGQEESGGCSGSCESCGGCH